MFKIEDLMSGDFSAYPEETRQYLESFTEALREKIIEELIEDRAEKVLRQVGNEKEELITVLTEILEKGHKGYNNMSTRALLNLYLENKGEIEFIGLIDKVSTEVEKL